MAKLRKNGKIVFILILAAAAALSWYAVFYFESHKNLLVTFFDIGQGDSVFIEVPNGNQVLIDGGPNNKVLSKLGRTMPFWDRSIDLLILTHPDADHLNGLLEVLRRYHISLVLETGVVHSTPQYAEWRKILKEKGIKTIIAERGQRISFGDGTVMDILAPFQNYAGRAAGKINNTAIVGRLVHGQNSVLLMADVEKSVEYQLLAEQELGSDILKVGHHGSKTSSVKEFLRAVSPEIAVIQVGRNNRYGHPTQEVLDRLAAVGAKIIRNDLEGDIIVESDGQSVRVK